MRNVSTRRARPGRRPHRSLRLAWTVSSVTVSAVLTAAVVAGVLVPRLTGATPYVVLTGSMAPALPPGTLVVDRPIEADDVAVGDVVTYQLVSGEPAVVTHRVVAVGVGVDGGRVLQTRGDANDSADPAWVRPVQLRGEVWYAVPYAGWGASLMTGHEREVVVTIVAWLLLGYAARMFLAAWRGRRHAPVLVPAGEGGGHG